MKNYKGLSESEVLSSREKYGKNVLTPPPSKPWWKLFLEKFKDPIILILLAAAVISIVVGIFEGNLIEPLGIIIAILLATGIGFWMEWSSKKKFDILNKVSDTESVKVIRNSSVSLVPKDELVVGDIVIISTGDEIPADLELLETTDLKISESTMTGESVPVTKRHKEDGENWTGSGYAPYLALRSTTVMEGSGVGKVVSVGDYTEIGKTTRQALEEVEIETPLQKQLNKLGGLITKVAFFIAALLLIFLNIHHFFFTEYDSSFMGIFTAELEFFMMAVVLVVAAAPEGLPVANVLSMAFAMKTMAKENNLVKKLHACETIGAVNIIFTDKTGTLTKNKMTVVDKILTNSKENMILNAAVNSTAELNEKGEPIGNPSEGAIIKYLKDNDIDYNDYRNSVEVVEVKPFNSKDKYMSTTIKSPVSGKKNLILVKGAPEVVLNMCNKNSKEEKDNILKDISIQQERGRRSLGFASGSDLKSLSYDGTYFIEDPIRETVPEAVKKCYRAGVDVVMMTGDNIKTASEIGRQAGFANSEVQNSESSKDVWGIEANDWKDDYAKTKKYPNVIARCKPENKLHILKSMQESGYVCAMTGDGVNDSPSLNNANVGIAMGSGTSVAKESADIVLLDDSFPSIVTGIKWGRSLYKNIQSFLTFQLTINVAFCLVMLFSPIFGVESPFSVSQVLWTNIVMDTLASLCLASEPADENVLNDKPRKPGAFIITKEMCKTIIGMGIFTFVVLSTILVDISNGSSLFGLDLTELFAIFLTLNWWNLFNIRVFGKHHSIFYRLFKNKNFIIGSLVILFGTILIVQFGGSVFNTRPLSLNEWLIIIAATSPVVIVRELWHMIKTAKE